MLNCHFKNVTLHKYGMSEALTKKHFSYLVHRASFHVVEAPSWASSADLPWGELVAYQGEEDHLYYKKSKH